MCDTLILLGVLTNSLTTWIKSQKPYARCNEIETAGWENVSKLHKSEDNKDIIIHTNLENYTTYSNKTLINLEG